MNTPPARHDPLEFEITFCVRGVVSPTLANIYLHYTFDLWADQWRRHHARGNVVLVRYADDTVAGFEYETDAKRFLADLRERLEKFALSLNPDKTRLIEFGRFAAERRARRSSDVVPKRTQALGVGRHCVVRQIATHHLSQPSALPLAALASATKSEGLHDVGSCRTTRGSISALRANNSSLAA